MSYKKVKLLWREENANHTVWLKFTTGNLSDAAKKHKRVFSIHIHRLLLPCSFNTEEFSISRETQQSLADGSVTLHIQSSFTSYFPRNHHCIISSVSVRSALMHNDRKLSSWHGVSRLFVDHQHLCLVHGNQWTCQEYPNRISLVLFVCFWVGLLVCFWFCCYI